MAARACASDAELGVTEACACVLGLVRVSSARLPVWSDCKKSAEHARPRARLFRACVCAHPVIVGQLLEGARRGATHGTRRRRIEYRAVRPANADTQGVRAGPLV
eukprot:3541839-Pleurochrysis_carterae.AAC.7